MSCRTNPSPIRFCTGDHGLAEPNRNHRLAPHNSAKQTGAKASARRSPDQAAPRQSQDTHRDKQRQGKRKALARPSSARAIAGHPPDQTAPGQTQGAPKAAHRGKLPPQLRQADRCQGKRKALARPSSAKANARRSPDQAVPGQSQDTHQDKQRRGKLPPSKPIRTSNARPSSARYTNRNRQPPGETGDFSLQRSGTISSGPLKKLRVSCVHERDGKQVPCVRSLCSYARESRAC